MSYLFYYIYVPRFVGFSVALFECGSVWGMWHEFFLASRALRGGGITTSRDGFVQTQPFRLD